MTLSRKRMDLPRRALHAALIALVLVWLYPLFWMVVSAFRTTSEVYADPLRLVPARLDFSNFERAWQTANFSRYLINSLVVTLGTTLLTVALAALAGFALGRRAFPGRAFILFLIGATMFLPQGYTIVPVYDLIGRLGLNNTLTGVVTALAGTSFAIYVFMFTAYFAGMPAELEEAALMDGASIHRIFGSVMLPLAGPMVATVFILEFIHAWNAFLIPLVLTLTRPDLRVLGVGMYAFFGENQADTTGLMAAAAIGLLPVVLVFLLFQRAFVAGMAGAVKS